MMVHKKVKAGALQLVLFVGAIIAVLLLCFMLLAHVNRHFSKKGQVAVRVIQTADDLIAASLIDPNQQPAPFAWGISGTIRSSYWGLLECRSVTTSKAGFTFEKHALVGVQDPQRPVLYLKDNQRPLVLAGNARIVGDALLPELGVKRGNINGQGYLGDQLVFGQRSLSTTSLPPLSAPLMEQLSQFDRPMDGEEVRYRKGMQLQNSFGDPKKIVRGSSLVLDEVVLTGHIVIQATTEIKVGKTARLSDVLLIAPKITIDPGFQGNLQALAREQIAIGKGAALHYPSVLAVRPNRPHAVHDQSPAILIAEGATIRGSVLYVDAFDWHRFKPHVRVSEQAHLIGELYSSQNVEIRGQVTGSVTTAGFVALHAGSNYQNHLYQGQLDVLRLPTAFAGVPFGETRSNQVMKWLY